MQLPLRERRARLRDLVVEDPGYIELVKSLDIDTNQDEDDASAEKTVRDFLEVAVTSGCEGLMVKTLDEASTYRAGARSYSWMKVKQDYLSENSGGSATAKKGRDTGSFLPDTLDLVPIGAYYGKGRRTGGFGSFLMATFNSATGQFEVSSTLSSWLEIPCGTFKIVCVNRQSGRLGPDSRTQR